MNALIFIAIQQSNLKEEMMDYEYCQNMIIFCDNSIMFGNKIADFFVI